MDNVGKKRLLCYVLMKRRRRSSFGCMETHRGLLTWLRPRPPAAAPLRIGGGGGGGRRGCRGSEDGCFGGLCLGGCVGREVCFCMGMVEEGWRFGGRGGWGQTRHPSCVSIGEERGRVAGLMQQRLTAWAESELVIKLIDERSTQRGGARPNSANQISICVSTGRSRGDDWPCLSWRRSLLLYLL